MSMLWCRVAGSPSRAPFREYQRIALAESVPFQEYVKGLVD